MRKIGLSFIGALLLVGVANGEEDTFIKPSDRAYLDKQSDSLYAPFMELVDDASKSVVSIWVGENSEQEVALGTVVKDNVVFAKFSDLELAMNYFGDHIILSNGEGHGVVAKVTGAYPEHDIAVIEAPELSAPPLRWRDDNSPRLGSFIALAGPNGQVGSVGVVSVRPRSFLGVRTMAIPGKSGVKVTTVQRGSAAEESGLIVGDQILDIGGLKVESHAMLTGVMQALEVGQEVVMEIERGKEAKTLKVTLDERLPVETRKNARVKMMRKMGTDISRKAEGFPSVMHSDMPLHPRLAGAPVVNSSGEAVGLVIARTSRIRTSIIPSRTILQLMETEPRAVFIEAVKKPSPEARRGRSERDRFELLRRLMGE